MSVFSALTPSLVVGSHVIYTVGLRDDVLYPWNFLARRLAIVKDIYYEESRAAIQMQYDGKIASVDQKYLAISLLDTSPYELDFYD